MIWTCICAGFELEFVLILASSLLFFVPFVVAAVSSISTLFLFPILNMSEYVEEKCNFRASTEVTNFTKKYVHGRC